MTTGDGRGADRELTLWATAQIQLAGTQRDQGLPIAQLDRNSLTHEALLAYGIIELGEG